MSAAKLVRSAGFRLALLHAVVFAFVIAALFGTVYWAASTYTHDQLTESIRLEGYELIGEARLQTFYVPGEHDMLVDQGASYRERYGRGSQGAGWYSFDQAGVHFVGLVNVVDLNAGGMGRLGDEQLEWLEDDLAGRSASTPIVVFAHIPLWTVYPEWGWGTEDAGQALGYLKRFGSVTVLNGHIHQVMQKVEGAVTFHTAMSTAFPQPRPGAADSPGPMKVPADRLRGLLGICGVEFRPQTGALAVVDQPLASA